MREYWEKVDTHNPLAAEPQQRAEPRGVGENPAPSSWHLTEKRQNPHASKNRKACGTRFLRAPRACHPPIVRSFVALRPALLVSKTIPHGDILLGAVISQGVKE